MQQSLFDYCIQHNKEHLLNEWNTAKNGSLSPKAILPGSGQKVWWICEKGHEWQAVLNTRALRNFGCPVCSNRRLVPGINDLATTHPHLIAQWHPDKNGSLTPQQVVQGSDRKVWWICEKGHEWESSIKNRTRGRNCPVCINHLVIAGENDLASHFPDLAKQWFQEKNEPLKPDQISFGSNKVVWWVCEHGHSWRACIASRTKRDRGCPYCAGQRVYMGFNDLASQRPEIAKDWHPTLNGTLTPEQVTTKSNRSVWWQCADGHVWKAYICNRTAKQPTGCPVCAGNISAAKRRHYERIAQELAADALFTHPAVSKPRENKLMSVVTPIDMNQTKEETL